MLHINIQLTYNIITLTIVNKGNLLKRDLEHYLDD